MSDMPERNRRDPGDDVHGDGEPSPPYPGWSTEQPPAEGWTAPGQRSAWTGGPPERTAPGQQSGWTASGEEAGPIAPGQAGWTGPGQQAGWTSPGRQRPGEQSGWTAPSGQSGWQSPGETRPQQQAEPHTPPGQYQLPGYPPGGWGAPAWGPPPPVKPGVIPLRPLGVGEILDGAVTTIRRNPGPMLGLSAVVAIIVQLIGLAATILMFRDLQAIEDLPATASPSEVFGVLGGTLGGLSVVAVVSWIATVILTGILTVVVSRAVLGQNLTVGQAWGMAKPRLLMLLLLSLVYILIAFSPVLVVIALAVVALDAGGADAALAAIGLASIPAVILTIWLYVRYALASPAFMLESTPGRHPGDPSRRIGMGKALRRSAELVRSSWWRLFGILILVWIVAFIVTQVISVLFSVPTYFFADPLEPESMTSLGVLSLSALGGIVSTTITAPFLAAAVALLYIDRRIRREALDVELARAAGVTIPGRTDQPPPMR
ncbi:MAG TPA: hypothetical protein VFY84_10145 [Jiangellales bacterium]|nr:hypothetical protein [Jiangellales bacterium]